MSAQAYVVNMRAGRPISVVYALVNDMVYAGLWAMLTPVILWYARKFPLTKANLRRTIPIHLCMSIAIAVAHKFIHTLIVVLYRVQADGFTFSWDYQVNALLSYFDYGVPLYWILILLNYAFDYYNRYKEHELKAAQLESQLAQAQLQALKMQLQPHFLFNTLNAIVVLIQKDPELARRTVGRLSELLRYTLDNVGSQEVSLREELDFLERYLQIEQTRFGDRLKVKLNVSDETREATVPNMILQPLVENAIKHGIARRRGDAVIEVSALREENRLRMSVRDNGVGVTHNDERREGIGLASTRARLRELYGDQQHFELFCSKEGGAEATVIIPFRLRNGK
jgi:sensor histidine kinase YesM